MVLKALKRFKTNAKMFRTIGTALGERTQNILYLTDNPLKAKSALKAGMRALIVLRTGNKQFSDEEMDGLLAVKELTEIAFLLN